jgi:TonB family protein
LHVGGAALALAHLNPEDGSDGLGANVAEIGVELTSPAVEDTELPPGPDADASVASPAIAEQKAEVKPTDLPKETPKESEEPDRVVTQNEQKKPTDDDPKVETVQTAASQESVAQEATAQQRLDNAHEANAAAAPNIGIGKDKQAIAATWARQISAYFELHKRYPKTDKIHAAKVKVSLVLNRLGHVISLGIAESSGDALFDEAALDMIRRSDPVPRPPAALTDDTFSYSLPVDFKDKK